MLSEADLAGMRETFGGVLTQTCVRRRFTTTKDPYNNDVRAAPAEVTLPCKLVHSSSSEDTVDRDTQFSEWVLRVEYDADIAGSDVVVVDDETFEVIGPVVEEADGFTIGRAVNVKHIEGG